MSTDHQSTVEHLRAENIQLKELLQQHGIDWQRALSSLSSMHCKNNDEKQLSASSALTPHEKIILFRRLFRGRSDVYPQRWESQNGKSGYTPVCDNEWQPQLCRKPKIKCTDCDHRRLRPLTDQVIYDHLAGKITVGVYPLLAEDTCYFLAMDFDDGQWQEDALAVMQSCQECHVPAALEISRSGKGAHIWIFFAEPVPAREARHLGTALMSHTCARTRQLSLASYDRFFPSQDTMPKGGFGNLIALPLQKSPRSRNCSIFVDTTLRPYDDQWAFMQNMLTMRADDVTQATLLASGGRHPLDVAFTDEDGQTCTPWVQTRAHHHAITGPLPTTLTLVLAQQIFIDKSTLPQSLLNRLIRLAAFANPEFYKAQAMRLPIWNKPRLIGCAENFAHHIALPRGCLDAVCALLEHNKVAVVFQDERQKGQKISVKFTGTLRKDQKQAMKAMLQHDIGILHAQTAFGKTVTAAALVARRKVSTLILVHRMELLHQWRERLAQFLDIPLAHIGIMGGGKCKPQGKIDIALLQSLIKKENRAEILDAYGHIVVDECHHISAFSFESVLKQAKARYVLGLTATPQRRDGHQPIIFMQCGPIRHSAVAAEKASYRLEVRMRPLPAPPLPEEATIQEIFQAICESTTRNTHIVADICEAWRTGRKVLALTERTSHLETLHALLNAQAIPCHILHGRLARKQRAQTFEQIKALPDTAARVILATGRLIGEGFDHSPLDTLVLAMPISWKGTLQQYAGRLHREHADKSEIVIYDYVEHDSPSLRRMWDKRRAGYSAMGYSVV